MAALDPFHGEDLQYLREFQHMIRHQPVPASLDEALACIKQLLNSNQRQYLDEELADFQQKLDGGYLEQPVPVGPRSQLQIVPELVNYNKDFAKIIFVWSLDDLGDGIKVYDIVNRTAASANRMRDLQQMIPFISFLTTALESLPHQFMMQTGVLLRGQMACFRSPSGASISPSERFPVGRGFYRYIFQAASKFEYACCSPDFLDTANPTDPGTVFEIELTPEGPAWDIEAFSYFTIHGRSEGEVLFTPLAYWRSTRPVARNTVYIAGHTMSPQVVSVQSVAPPICRFCQEKIHQDFPELHYQRVGCHQNIRVKEALKIALDCGDSLMVRTLFAADPTATDNAGDSLIVWAVKNNQTELSKLLLNNGVTVEPLCMKLENLHRELQESRSQAEEQNSRSSEVLVRLNKAEEDLRESLRTTEEKELHISRLQEQLEEAEKKLIDISHVAKAQECSSSQLQARLEEMEKDAQNTAEKLQLVKVLGIHTAEVLARQADSILRCSGSLTSHDVKLELEALKLLGMLRPEVLAPRVDLILRCLDLGTSDDVKLEARKLLGSMTPEMLAPHVHLVLRRLDLGTSDDVQLEARKLLGSMTPEMLAPHVDLVLHRLKVSTSDDVQLEALKLLDSMTPEMLVPHVDLVLRSLEVSTSDDVQLEALKLLGSMTPEILAPHVFFVLRRLDLGTSDDVQLEALKLLGSMRPEMLAPHVHLVLRCLDLGTSLDVKLEALKLLDSMTPEMLAAHLHLESLKFWKFQKFKVSLSLWVHSIWHS